MSDRKLGIIAGGGTIPQMLIDHCREQNREYFVLAIEGNANPDIMTDDIPHLWLRIGQAGTGFKRFADEKVQDVVMIGTIKRPSFKEIFPDLRTAAFFAKIGTKALGDDGILRALVKELESEGMAVKGIHEVMPDILIKSGVYGKHKPDKQAIADIKRGVDVALALGQVDVGQSVIVQEGLVLGVEGIEGTDNLIKRCAEYKRKGDGGVLIKLRKPTQDMRIDLPTIGVRTVQNAKDYGLRGIAVHAGNGLIVDEPEVVKLANKLGLFLIGIKPEDYSESRGLKKI